MTGNIYIGRLAGSAKSNLVAVFFAPGQAAVCFAGRMQKEKAMFEKADVKWVFFDMGYTLVDEGRVWERRFAEQAQTAGARKLGLTAGDLYNEVVLASRAYLPQWRTVAEKFRFDEVAPYRREEEILYGDAKEVLCRLSAKYRLGIIANQGAGLKMRLGEYGISQYIATVASSFECGCMKPDRRLFEIALEESGCLPEHAVMVGDRLDNDVYPAKALGMGTIWIRQGFGGMQEPRSDAYRADHTVDTLSGLLALL